MIVENARNKVIYNNSFGIILEDEFIIGNLGSVKSFPVKMISKVELRKSKIITISIFAFLLPILTIFFSLLLANYFFIHIALALLMIALSIHGPKPGLYNNKYKINIFIYGQNKAVSIDVNSSDLSEVEEFIKRLNELNFSNKNT
jgi:hypothetical protein